MDDDNDILYNANDIQPIWNLYQLGLATLCFISVSVLYKIPIDHYFGSGWTLISIIIFLCIFAAPIIYLQLRFGTTFKTGILGIMDKFLPLGLVFTIGCFLRNFIHVIYTSALITHCLTYIFFSIFNCDGKVCVGGTYPWSSCKDAWAGGDCRDGVSQVYNFPTAEEKFYHNFVLMQTPGIDINEYFPEWFLYNGLIIVPHILTWLLLLAIIIGGAKIFGKILYGLIPAAVILYLSVFIYVIVMYADDLNQKSTFYNWFYTRFPNHVPVVTTEWDQYAFEPLIWGFLSTLTHLSIGMNLWNGVYPIMGKWISAGKKTTHLSWLIVIIVFGAFVSIPTLLNVAFLASSYSDRYLRCDVSRSWSFPFTIAAHVFTKFATHKALTVCYYTANLFFLLASEGFLLVASIETIIDHMRQWHNQIATHLIKSYRISCLIIITVLCCLSFSTIIKSGYYWIYLMDFYVDRLLCLLMIGQAISIIVIYGFLRNAKFEGKLLKILCLVFLSIICVVMMAPLVWYSIEGTRETPTKDCYYQKLDPNKEPIPPGYVGLGWFIAICPLLLGLLIAPILIFVHSRRRGITNECLYYSIRGEQIMPHNETNDGEEEHMIEMGKKDTLNVTTLGKMQKMKGTLQSEGWQQPISSRSYGETSTSSNVYANDSSNILYDQRQSLRRPLVSPDSSNSEFLSHTYTPVKKTKKRIQPNSTESDI